MGLPNEHIEYMIKDAIEKKDGETASALRELLVARKTIEAAAFFGEFFGPRECEHGSGCQDCYEEYQITAEQAKKLRAALVVYDEFMRR